MCASKPIVIAQKMLYVLKIMYEVELLTAVQNSLPETTFNHAVTHHKVNHVSLYCHIHMTEQWPIQFGGYNVLSYKKNNCDVMSTMDGYTTKQALYRMKSCIAQKIMAITVTL